MFSTEILEFEKVLNIVKGYCISEYSSRRLLEVKPLTDLEHVDPIFTELKELFQIRESGFSVDIKKINDTTRLLERALIRNNHLDLSLLDRGDRSFQLSGPNVMWNSNIAGEASTSRYRTGRDRSSKYMVRIFRSGEPTSTFNLVATIGPASPAVMTCSAVVTWKPARLISL